VHEHMIVPVEWKTADGGGPGEIEGYFSVFGNVDQGDDVVLPGAYKNTLRYWAKQAQAGQPLPLIADHELSTDGVIGSVTNAREDGHGGWFRAGFSSDPKAQSIRTKMIEGHLRGMSFTYDAVKHYMGTVGGKSVRFLQELKLFEVTVTPFPMNTLALASAKADQGNITTPDAADLNAAARRYCISQGWSMPDGSYPVRPANLHGGSDLGKAIHAVGRGGSSHDAIRRHIIARARAIGMSDQIPDNWSASGSASLDRAQLRDAMHKALEIPSAAARKAAADVLLDEYLTEGETEDVADGAADEPEPAAGGAGQDTPGEGGTEGTPDGLTPREYADQIMQSGTADGSPASLDQLEARIRNSLGETP